MPNLTVASAFVAGARSEHDPHARQLAAEVLDRMAREHDGRLLLHTVRYVRHAEESGIAGIEFAGMIETGAGASF